MPPYGLGAVSVRLNACVHGLAVALLFGAPPIAAKETCSVAVDVGHLVSKPGATSARGIPEFQFNQALAKTLRTSLEAKGCQVAMVNEDGDIPALRDRTAKAGDARLFVSIHHDSVQPHYLENWEFEGADRGYSDRFSGYSLFVSRDNPFPEKSLQCASAIGAALQASGFPPSYYHAEPIPGENRPFADRSNGVHYYDRLVVLHTAKQPAVLIEAGVIVNRKAEQVLAMSETRENIAQAIAEGIATCLTSRTDAHE
ncbi:MAG: N-acetylmuramoyl-L-alanine amidase [Betaproteobacteria bacterium]|nr:N-acetylmuramoyl-L-alanine amidase [Betaproteobacteria bacterium]